MEDLISVVVPIYNVENYIKKCVDSILSQTYKNLEIILVDDGSPDNCPQICDEYAQKDNRIKVIHKENGGLSDARNAGIDISKGKFITFIDSDDYIEKDYVEVLYNSIKESIRQAKIGRIWVKGNYQFMISDPVAQCRNALGLSPDGLLDANHVYSNFWNERGTFFHHRKTCISSNYEGYCWYELNTFW